MNSFPSLPDYEKFIYTIRSEYSFIISSTLKLVRKSKSFGTLSGDLIFDDGFRLHVTEYLSWDSEIVIESYGYEFWQCSDKIAWYDSQPHPDNPSLAENHPHHKHIPPDIKHNRIPATKMSFTEPNLPLLIKEMEELVQGKFQQHNNMQDAPSQTKKVVKFRYRQKPASSKPDNQSQNDG